MKGLIIREPWIGMILDGSKKWELRTQHTTTGGEIALIRKSTGQIIAKSGQSGEVGSPQLHFELRKGTSPVDPLQFLNGA